MALGTNKRSMFLGIKDGKITLKRDNGVVESYSYIEGFVREIRSRDQVMSDGQSMRFRDFIIEDGNDRFNLSSSCYGSVARGIALCLANIPNIASAMVRISPYIKKGSDYTNIAVYADGQKVDWLTTDIPALEVFTRGNKQFTDSQKRDEWLDDLCASINDNIRAASAYDASNAPEVEYERDYHESDDLPAGPEEAPAPVQEVRQRTAAAPAQRQQPAAPRTAPAPASGRTYGTSGGTRNYNNGK